MCNLRRNLHSWRQIDAPNYVINWIQNGLPISLKEDIRPFEQENHKLTFIQSSFIDQEIKRLLLCGFIEHCDVNPLYISPIGCVPKKNRKFRLITDLRHLNKHCVVPKFRNEDILDAVKFIRPDDKFVTTDIKDVFFSHNRCI